MKLYRLALLSLCLLVSYNVNAQLVADFTANSQTGCEFATINFTNTSTDGGVDINCGAGYSYTWDFGAGSNANQCSPGNIFSAPGTYTVCLTVTNDNTGESITECKTDFITIFPPPVASFNTSVNSGCGPLEVCFTNTSTVQSGSLTSCLWDFGDGEVLDDCSPGQICHTYIVSGNYMATLTIQDSNGCPPVSESSPITVFSSPDIQISADQTLGCTTPLMVNFSNDSPVTAGVIFNWTFEGADMPMFEGITPPSITWSNEGIYDVTVVASSPEGCTDTLVLDDYITVGNLINFTPNTYTGCLGDTIFFSDLSAGNPISWTWDFGDGTGASSQQNPFYIFTTPGCYSVTLTVDNGSCLATVTDPVCIDISDFPSISVINDNPNGCELPHLVNFTTTGTDPAGTFEWIFGADTIATSTNAAPSFPFNSFNNHEIILNYTSPTGCTVSSTDFINVQELQVELLGTTLEGCAPLTVTLQDDAISITPIIDWQWEIPGMGTFSQQNPTLTFTDTGSYDVILQVTNDLGCVAIDTFESYIQTGAPQMVDFSANPLVFCADDPVSFTDLSSPFVDQWFWQFGDGPNSIAFDQNPTHEFIDTGFFQVCLTVFQNGCENTICKPDYVYSQPAISRFQVIQDCATPYFYQFNNVSIGADSLSWDFGDGASLVDTSSLDVPSYTYPSTGNYTVELVAYNFTTGCTDTSRAVVNVTDPIAQFSLTDTIGCRVFSVNPIDSSIDAVSWSWNSLGGGVVTDGNTQFPTISYSPSGLYPNDLELIVADVNGCLDTLNLDQDIYVSEIIADFTIEPDTGCVPLTVTLTENSTNIFGNNITYDWRDLQGQVIIGPDPQVTMTFTTADTFSIRLRIDDDLGCARIITFSDTIVTTEPIALFTADTVACTEQPISFINQSEGEQLTYLWDFDDGNTSTSLNPTHDYLVEGVYNVCLTATDILGCDSTHCQIITIENPVANFVADTTFAFCPPLVVSFTNLSQNSVSGGNIWNFGDGTGLSFADNPAHVYTQAGSFDVTLITTGASGCTDTIVFQDYIQLEGPVGDITYSNSTGCAPVTITFTSTSLLPTIHIIDYGDGTIDSSAVATTMETFTYTYTQAGDYLPSLILEDEMGCNQVFDGSDIITVEELFIDFFASDSLLCDGGITNFTSVITSSEPVTYTEWTFEGQTPNTSLDANPVNMMYNTNGTYDVELEVSNGVCTDSITKLDYIAVEPTPAAAFVPSITSGCAPLTVTFTDGSSVSAGTITNWSWDFDDTNGSTDQSPTHTFTADGSYTVELAVFTTNGCTDTITSIIDVLPLPDVETGTVPSICIGESVQLTASMVSDPTGVTYLWDNAATLSCTDCLNPIANPTVTTTYTIITTAPNGCTDMATIIVDVIPFPLPVIGLGPDTTICEGTTVQLFASGGTSDPASYDWDTSNAGLSCYGCPNPFATPVANTQYTITVTGPGGCMASDTIGVSIFDPSQTFAGPDVTICLGESTSLSDGGFGNNPAWSPITGLSCAFCPNPTANPTVTTTYGITVDDPIAGCPVTDSVTVVVVPTNTIDAGDGILICSSDPVQLNGMGDGNLTWSPAGVLDDPFIANPTATITQNTVFYLTSTNGNCVLMDSVEITVTDSVVISVPDVTICLGESAQLVATGTNAQSYLWSPAEGLSSPNIPDPVATVDETTTYSVGATFGSCPSNVEEVTVTVNPLPEASLLPIHNYYEGSPVQLLIDVNPNADYSYSWTPSTGLSCDDCIAPLANPDTNTVYTVLVTDLLTGCEIELQTLANELSQCSEQVLAVPNAFSPNGDGNNDILYVRSTAISNIRAFRVFDRWGAMVFETETMGAGWDGDFGGKTVNPGVFVYYVEAICPVDGSTIIKKGNVTVVK